MSKNQNEKVFL